MKSIKNKIFKIIQPTDNSSILSKMFDLVIVTLILINTVTIIAATFSLSALKIRIFLIIEIVSVIIFSVEYIFTEVFSRSFVRGRYFHGFSLEGLFYYSES